MFIYNDVTGLIFLMQGTIDSRLSDSGDNFPILNQYSKSNPDQLHDGERQHINVLIVEDNDTNKFITRTMVEKLGFTSFCASNGEEALGLLKSETIHIILMDIMMPIMNGVEATRAIRSRQDLQAFRDIPIVALTAVALHDSRENYLKEGMNDYLSKPVDIATLDATILRWTI